MNIGNNREYVNKDINGFIINLEKLVKNDTKQNREKIAAIGSKMMNKKYDQYKKLDTAIQDVVDDLFVMDEVDGYKEPKILHLNIKEVKNSLQKLKKSVK